MKKVVSLILIAVMLFAIMILCSCECKEHRFVFESTAKHATCTEEGIEIFQCKNCSEQERHIIPALGHNYLDGICTICGE